MSSRAIIRLEGIEKTYVLGEENIVHALAGVDLRVDEGSFVAIMGPSGSGKSTMLNLLGCLDRPSAGRYLLGDEDVSQMTDDAISEARGRRIGFIFQSYNLIAQLTVIENIQVPLLYQGKDLKASYDRCVELARMVGLGERLDHRPTQLSGGQQQRVAIARSLVNDPLMILADEPTGNLDTDLSRHLIELFKQFNTYGTTIIMATHNREVLSWAPEARQVHLVRGSVSLPQAEIVDEAAPARGRARA